VPAYEVVLQRPYRQDRFRYKNRADAEVVDVLEIEVMPWVIIEMEPPFEFRPVERLMCAPYRVRDIALIGRPLQPARHVRAYL
jgi:hypothetical protein